MKLSNRWRSMFYGIVGVYREALKYEILLDDCKRGVPLGKNHNKIIISVENKELQSNPALNATDYSLKIGPFLKWASKQLIWDHEPLQNYFN